MSNFDGIFDFVVGSEGGFTDNPADPGNWTGGKIGAGECRGTRFGISAGAHPDLDIADQTNSAISVVFSAICSVFRILQIPLASSPAKHCGIGQSFLIDPLRIQLDHRQRAMAGDGAYFMEVAAAFGQPDRR